MFRNGQLTQKEKLTNLANNSYYVVSFKDGLRTLTYSGLDAIKVTEHIAERSRYGQVCLVFPMGFIPVGVKSDLHNILSDWLRVE